MPQTSITPVKNLDILSKSNTDLSGQWGQAILVCIMSLFVSTIASFFPFGSLIISGPLSLGSSIYFLNVARNKEAKFEHLFDGFKNFGNATGAFILMVLFTLLWSLLFIIPGIIAMYSYSLTFFILIDEPETDAMGAIIKSKEMMKGHKMDLFILSIKYFLLSLLCLLSFGIGFLWLIPYMNTGYANFYNNLRGNEDPLNLEDNLVL